MREEGKTAIMGWRLLTGKLLTLLVAIVASLGLVVGLAETARAAEGDETYVLADTLEDGGEYIITNNADVGADSTRALKNPGAGSSTSGTTISQNNGKKTMVIQEGNLIENSDESIVWTATSNGNGFNLTNNSDYLEGYTSGNSGNSSLRVFGTQRNPSWYWTYSDNQLKHNGTNTYTMRYSNGSFGVTTSSSNDMVYLFKKVTEQVDLKGITLTETTLNLEEGDTQKLTVTFNPTNATNKQLTWASNNETVATVDTKGNVTAVGPGSATITVTSNEGSYTQTCAVKVTAASTVTYKMANTMEAGKEYLIATTADGSGYILSGEAGSVNNSLKGYAVSVSDNKLTITTKVAASTLFSAEGDDDNSIRLKLGDGYLYADNRGSLRLADSDTVTSSDNNTKFWHYRGADGESLLWLFEGTDGEYGYTSTQHNKYYLNVSDAGNFTKGSISTNNQLSQATNIPKIYLFVEDDSTTPEPKTLTGIALSGQTAEFTVGETFTYAGLVVTAAYTDGTTADVTSKAKVDSSAVDTTKVGTYKVAVSYTEGDVTKTAEYDVTVKEAPQTEIYKLVDKLSVGGEYLIVNANAAGSAYALKNAGNDSTIASSGYATTVTVKDGSPNYIETADVSIVWKASENADGLVKLTNGKSYLEGISGNVGIFDAEQYADRGWSYADTNLTFGGSGTNTVYTLRYSSSRGYFQGSSNSSSTNNALYLYAKEGSVVNVPVTGVTLSPTTLELKEGLTGTLTATVEPDNATNKKVAWTSSDGTVATVDENGTVTGVSTGSATITATTADGSFTATSTVTVTPSTMDQFVLTDELEDGGEYLIVNTNEPGSAYALKNPGGTSGGATIANSANRTAVTIVDDTIYASDDAIVWTATANGEGVNLTNDDGYLEGSSSSVSVFKPQKNADRYWTYDADNLLQHKGGSSTYTLRYSSSNGYFQGSSQSYGSSNNKVYLFKKVTEKVDVTGITVEPQTATVEVKRSIELTATVQPENASNKKVTWTSGDESIATVDANGKVKGVSEGTVTITAASKDNGDIKATCEVTVTPNTSGESHYVITIGTHALSTEPTDDQLVNNNGQYIYSGLAGVEYASGDDTDDTILWELEETDGGYYIKSLDGRYLNATYGTEGGVTRGVLKLDETPDVWAISGDLESWQLDGSMLKSTNASATASTPKFLAYEEGSTSSPLNLFTIRSESNADSTKVEEVAAPATTVKVSGVTLGKEELTLEVNGNEQLTYEVTPANATDKSVTWTSSDEDVATVDENGSVTAVGAGTATITVTTTDGSFTDTCAVTVSEPVVPVSSVTLNETEANIVVGMGITLEATVNPDNATDKTVTWASSDGTVATVNENGEVQAVGVGTATITATAGGKTAECVVTVTEEQTGATWVRLSGKGRYDTMAAIVQEGFDSSAEAILCTGKNFPDALVAASLAGALDGDVPVILTAPDALSAQAEKELKRLKVSKVYVLGGAGVVSEDVLAALDIMHITYERVSGSNRQATSLAVMQRIAGMGKFDGTVVVATGKKTYAKSDTQKKNETGFADALSIGPWCYKTGTPILLTKNDGTLTEEQVSVAKALGVKNLIIVGGTGAVSDAVIDQLGVTSSLRLGGKDRYETSSFIAAYELSQGMTMANTSVATGTNFPDALAGAPLCGKNNSVLLLVKDVKTTATLSMINNESGVETGYVLGGTGAVSEEIFSYLEEAVTKDPQVP